MPRKGVEDIARFIAEVAKGANDVTANTAEVSKAATDVSRSAAEAASAAGRWREAFRCFREAGDEEGLARVREKLPDYDLYTPQGK